LQHNAYAVEAEGDCVETAAEVMRLLTRGEADALKEPAFWLGR